MSAGEVFPAVDHTIRAGNLRRQPQVYADLCFTNRGTGVFHFALQVDIPVPPSILGETAGLDHALDGTGEPQAKVMPAVGDRIALQVDRGTFEGNPPQRTLPAPPLQPELFELALARDIFLADSLNGLRRQMQVFGSASGQHMQIVGRQIRLIPMPGKQAHFLTIVPDVVDGTSHSLEVLA
jgi:hypothetical protein